MTMTIHNIFYQLIVGASTTDTIGLLTQYPAIMEHIAESSKILCLAKTINSNIFFSPILELENIPSPLMLEHCGSIVEAYKVSEVYNSTFNPDFKLLPFSLLIDSVSNPALIQEMFNSIKTMSEESLIQSMDVVTIKSDYSYFKYILNYVSNFTANSIEGQQLSCAQNSIRLLFYLSRIIISKNNPNYSSELANVSDSKAETIAEHVAVAHFSPIRKSLKSVIRQEQPEIYPIFEYPEVEAQYLADQTVSWGAISTLSVFRDYQVQEKGIQITKKLITDLSDLV